MVHIPGFTRSHWMPPLGKCLHRIALAATSRRFWFKTQNTPKKLFLAKKPTVTETESYENFGPRNWPSISSSMWQALFKCKKKRLELKSSATFLSIKRCEGTKNGKVINSLTAKCVAAGTKNSLSEDFLLAKLSSHKHPHHDEPFSPLASWVPWMNIPHPQEPLWKGLDEATIEGFSIKL